jgi:transcription-repair coupling factor (superfamily II helicase)
MTLSPITQVISSAANELVSALQAGQSVPCLSLRRAARLPLLAALYDQLSQPILFVTGRSDQALLLADELGTWSPNLPRLLFPEPNPLFYENAPWGLTTRRDRLIVLNTLASYHIPNSETPPFPPVIIAPARALMTRTLPRRDFLKALRTLRPGQVIQPDELVRSWMTLGYEPVSTVVAPGQFARRGGILDIWNSADTQPVRLDFFGDEIDTLRRFDPATQRTIQALQRLQVTPAREYMVPRG